MINTYSQAGQDIFVSSLIKGKNKTFVDIGCQLPNNINNTLLLEQNGWTGISLDIMNYSEEWKIRNTPFVVGNALTMDYATLFDNHSLPKTIDYLSVDIEGNGDRFRALKQVFESNRDFKIITIEHDSYRGYELTEAIPQREFLLSKGYVLLCVNVHLSNNPFEDWWINPKYFDESEYIHLKSENVEYVEILKKIK